MRVSRIVVLAVLAFAFTALPASALDLEVDVKPPPGEVGTPYEFQFFGEEGCLPYRFSYLNGTLPPGLRITVDGKLTGTPTEAGTFSFWVALDDNGGPTNPYCLDPSVQSQGEFTMIVMPDLAVQTTSLPTATPARPYSVQLEFTNPEVGWPVVWDITQGALPAGLALSESGVISGTPAGADAKTFVVRAREPFRRFGERELTLRVAAALQGSSSLGAGEVGLRYAGSVSASGGVSPFAYSVAIGDLPAGLALNAVTGAVRGIPQGAGTYGLTFAITDSGELAHRVAAGDYHRAPLRCQGRHGLPHSARLDRRPCTKALAHRKWCAPARDPTRRENWRALRCRSNRRRISVHDRGA
jgi:hypothetical protein